MSSSSFSSNERKAMFLGRRETVLPQFATEARACRHLDERCKSCIFTYPAHSFIVSVRYDLPGSKVSRTFFPATRVKKTTRSATERDCAPPPPLSTVLLDSAHARFDFVPYSTPTEYT